MTAAVPVWQPVDELLRAVVDDRLPASPGVSLLEVLAARPAWHADAACAGDDVDLEVFFPRRGESTGPARAVCAACPVVDECRTYAVGDPDELVGVWGGTSARERRLLRREPVVSNGRRPVAVDAVERLERFCGACGAPFEAGRSQLYCDRRCKRRAGYARRGY